MDHNTLKSKAEAFLALHQGEDILVLPNAWDGASAVVLAEVGFPAIASTSAGVAFARGLPDGQVLTSAEMCAEVARMTELVDVPVTADMEAGYGDDPETVAKTVRQVIAAGAVGANIEDGTGRSETPLYDRSLGAERIAAARDAADAAGLPFVINARTAPYLYPDAFGETAFAEAVERANAYREAGARCLYVPQAFDTKTIEALVREIDGPLNILASATTPATQDLRTMGVARLSVGGGFARAAYSLARNIAEELKTDGTYSYTNGSYSNADLNALLRGRLST